jgi:hypothetical protein
MMRLTAKGCGISRETGGVTPLDRSSEGSLVLAVFDDENVAETAMRALRRRMSDAPEGSDVSIGMLLKRADASIPAGKLGPHATDTGAGVGAILGIVALAIAGGKAAGPAPAARGAFFHEGSGLTADDISRLGAELDAGRVVLGALAAAPEGGAWVIVELAALGGKAEAHFVTEDALRAAAEVSG